MNFGSNLYNMFVTNAQNLVLVGLIVIGVYLLIQKKTSQLISLLLIGIAAVLLVFNTTGVKDLLLSIGNQILGAGT